jgi:uncharacterized protein (DUF2236 family)
MSPEEREIFFIDPKTIDWNHATCLYARGVDVSIYFANILVLYEQARHL